MSVGASHAAALSAGGDCFMWGVGTYGRLGFGHLRPVPVPTLLIGGLPKDTNTVRELRHEEKGAWDGGGRHLCGARVRACVLRPAC